MIVGGQLLDVAAGGIDDHALPGQAFLFQQQADALRRRRAVVMVERQHEVVFTSRPPRVSRGGI